MSLAACEVKALGDLRSALKIAIEEAKKAQISVSTDYTAGNVERQLQNALDDVESELGMGGDD